MEGRWVDEVIPNAPWKFDPAWIEKYSIDLVVHGDDYSQEQLEYFYELPLELGRFRTIPYTPGISTTDIIRRCQEANVTKTPREGMYVTKELSEESN